MSDQWSSIHARPRVAPPPRQPPDYRSQYGVGQAAAPPARATRRLRWQIAIIAALAGALLAVGLAGYLAFASQTGTASVAAQRFCDALVARDYPTAYADLSAALQGQGTEEQFAASQQDLDRIDGVVTSCALSYVRVSGSRAVFRLNVTRARTGMATGVLQLVFERNTWKVDAYDANVI
jgi:hypothetical protein